MPPRAPRRETIGFAVAAVAGIVLSAATSDAGDILLVRWGVLGRLAVWTAVWVVAVVCALRLPRRVALPAVFAVAVALRLAALAGAPYTSDDLYRYAWDGRVQAAGLNPYRYPPDSPAVARLREPWLWPDDAGCAVIRRPPGCTRINRPAERTIYPPAAQAWFQAVYRLGGVDTRHKAWQVAGLAADVGLIALLPLALRTWGRDERWTALYALSPFSVMEAVNNGHVDGLAALAVVAALVLAGRRRPASAGALLGAAVLVKLYPGVLLAALGARRRLALVLAAVAAAAVVAAGYLPYVIGEGVRVLGYRPGYLQEENYGQGDRYLLAGILGLPPAATTAVAAAGAAGVLIWVLVGSGRSGHAGRSRRSGHAGRSRRSGHAGRPDVARGQAALLGALLLAATPVQPWYAVVLLAVATVAAAPAWATVAAAGYPYYFAVIFDHPNTVAIGRASYGLALVAVVLAGWRRRPSTIGTGGTQADPAPARPRGRRPGAGGARHWWRPRVGRPAGG